MRQADKVRQMVKVSSLVRMIGRALYVISLFLILFWLFTSHRPAVYAPTFATLFFTSIFLTAAGSLTIRASEKMQEKAAEGVR